ncbi:TetR family transcriptional regulator [Gordonia sp. LSe1-13]|uniref:TetR family transcriptional regulator n=1 Tax=Gordonia sesuvii TaxID=3116777 RepID=A0ABU7M8E8_9ACTN|nr:TetR family transcriptional regulator [Gordonia sp. LSe1-13]
MTIGRNEQVALTRGLLLRTAERMFAEEGISTVSNRRISEAAGQGNNFAVGYHFGGKLELLRAILGHHNSAIEPIRRTMLSDLGPQMGMREWISCLVRPQTDYLRSLGTPTYFARFCAQVTTDPKYGPLLYEQKDVSEELISVLTGMYAALPSLPPSVLEIRDTMARNMIVLTLADHERACAAGEASRTWEDVGEQLVDALIGVWLAPVTHE